ncbi:MAG: hypothetical protein OEU86_07950, partial [Gammaproteobacteria bacterium]|nr:hypothetical protein [Gammaproteobacteria bacterium]
MRDSVGVPIIVFTRNDEHLSTINNILRQAGTAAHCIQINTPTELEQTLGELTPELLLHLEDEKSIEIS